MSRLGKPQPNEPVERGMVGEQWRRRAAMDDAAALDHERILRQRERNVGVLLHEDESVGALARHAPDRGDEFFDGDRRQTFERLVEQKERRLGSSARRQGGEWAGPFRRR